MRVRLVGTASNRSAIGARLRADVVEDGKTRSIHRTIASASSSGSGPLAQTIGVGRAGVIETLEVFWPTSGVTQTLRDVPAGVPMVLTEPGPPVHDVRH